MKLGKQYKAGEQVGQMIFLEDMGHKGRSRIAKFMCQCGNETVTFIHCVKSRKTMTCGCIRQKLYEKGEMIGNLKYLGFAGIKKETAWGHFLCYCGKEFQARIPSIRLGLTKSCGCYRIVKIKETNIKHGHTCDYQESSEYNIWEGMRQRCMNVTNDAYMDYGGRGIEVCERWKHSFENFYSDMGKRPSLKHTLDRYPDQNGNYEPSNCRWATKKEQANNRRSNVLIEYKGEVKTLKQWCEALNMSYKLVHKRIKQFNWTIDEAFNTPVKRESRYLYGYNKKAA